jgi:hypothetical protein
MLNVYIRNLDGKPTSTYEYIVMVNAEKIAEGKVKHKRKDGWAVLVKKIAEQHTEERP